jgi:hypothetical protein
MPEIGPPPEPINSAPVDREAHWSVWDQTKAEFKKSGRSGIIISVDGDNAYRAKLAAFLAKYNTSAAELDPTKPFLVIEHATQSKALFQQVLAAGLNAELI